MELERVVGAFIGAIAGWLALLGGAMLAVLAALTVVSVTGRTLVWAGLGPIPGDYELMEAGCAFAVFSFLPWCQFRRGHVTVDVFLSRAPARVRAGLSVAGNLLLTGTALLIAWRFQAGLADKLETGESTFILGMPVWYGYGAALPGVWLFAVVCGYTVWRSFNEMRSGVEGS